MASWKKHFSAVPTQARLQQKYETSQREGGAHGMTNTKFNSYLPEVYSGSPNRIERYLQYEYMDNDGIIARALDTIADFSTQSESDTESFSFKFNNSENLTETEMKILSETLSQWTKLNKWKQRLWRMFRNVIKYGDQIYIRDPETFKLIWIDHSKVDKIIVNESKGKEIEQYVIRDVDLNLQTLVGTNVLVHDQYNFPSGYPRNPNTAAGAGTINYGASSGQGTRNNRFNNTSNQTAVNATHVVHLSLSEGMDSQWPFGTSILESVYKVFKQKDLLEDSIIIYRIVRAPERRVFYIDVGQLQGQKAMSYVERIKQEIYSRRIPNRTNDGKSVIDASYSPISINEDYFLATNSEGKGTRIESLPGGENLGCFSLDTKVKLLDGRDLSIMDISNELASGKQLWTYSCHPITGEIVPGKISWSGKTKSSAKVMKITLDNGETITCTPDHKFPIKGIGFIEAQELGIDRELITLGTKNIFVSIIEYLEETMDVGTLSIDSDEEYHNYHTFALSVGVFVKNSIDDLRYFSNVMMRTLGIPSSYLPTGPEDSQAIYNDGKVGTAYIQEYRFSKYCQRLQNLMAPILDKEFKMFLKNRGIEISSAAFELQFWPPQSFSQYRQIQIDSEQINVFSGIMNTSAARWISQRFAAEKYLGWSQDDILKNETMWKEENNKKVKSTIGTTPLDNGGGTNLSSVGLKASSPGDFGELGSGEEGLESPPAEGNETEGGGGAGGNPAQTSPSIASPPGGGAAPPGPEGGGL